MNEKRSVSIDASLYNEIKCYCEANNLKTNETIESWLRDKFIIEKWGEIPSIFLTQEELDTKPIKVITTKKETKLETETNSIPNTEVTVTQLNTNNNLTKGKTRRLK